MAAGIDRYVSKRAAGISPQRYDGSLCSADTDVQSAAAEEWAARYFGVSFNDEIYSNRGDGGYDFVLNGQTIEVIWLGYYSKSIAPRTEGHLLVNPEEPHRWADVYILIKGSVKVGFQFAGWMSHQELIKLPKKDMGYGRKFAAPTSKLHNIESLRPEGKVYQHMVIDGKNAINRAVYAGYNDKKFRESGNDYFLIFLKFMHHYYSSFHPKQIHICWDDRRDNLWRREMYPEYKANRGSDAEIDPIIKRQVKLALAVCKSMGFRQYFRPRQEADDLIYAFCRSITEPTLVVSSDSDLRQISYHMSHTALYNPMSKERKETGAIAIDERSPYEPTVYKSLVGDKTDNIEGYDGIGPIKGRALTLDLAARSTFLKIEETKFRRNRILVDLGLNPHLLDNMLYIERQMASKPKFAYKDIIIKLRDLEVKGVVAEADKYIVPFANLS